MMLLYASLCKSQWEELSITLVEVNSPNVCINLFSAFLCVPCVYQTQNCYENTTLVLCVFHAFIDMHR